MYTREIGVQSLTTESRIFRTVFGSERIDTLFTDAHFVREALHVEGTLARVQGQLGLIPATAAAQIEAATKQMTPDVDDLSDAVEKAGVPVAALVAQLRRHVGGEAANYVHWGATTQDIMDTARVLQIREALVYIAAELQALIEELAQLANAHRDTLMAGRTHSQQALPITFGVKVANWLAPLLRHRQRLAQLRMRLLVVQFGGAVGTLAAVRGKGVEVQQGLAQALDLGVGLTPWHTQRDNFAELASWLSLLGGSLAKMAQDIILLMQSEVDEVRETADTERGGSSTMPQKQNPVKSEQIIAAARSNAALLASMHQALIQEHERATHGWQMEWLALPQMFSLTTSALEKALFVARNLIVNADKMRQNVAASQGLMLAEALVFALSPPLPRQEAKELVRDCALLARDGKRHLVDVVRERVDAPIDWEQLREDVYVGEAQAFIDRVLDEAVAVTNI